MKGFEGNFEAFFDFSTAYYIAQVRAEEALKP